MGPIGPQYESHEDSRNDLLGQAGKGYAAERVSSAFADFLRQRILARYPSLRAFVRAAEPQRSEDAAVAYLSKVLKGRKPPPLERVGAWADALALTGHERAAFIEDAHVAHASPVVQTLVERLRDECETARRAASPPTRYRP